MVRSYMEVGSKWSKAAYVMVARKHRGILGPNTIPFKDTLPII
jgi:hypothetical protein